MPCTRRTALVGALLLLLPREAHAGSYLDRSAWLLGSSRHDRDSAVRHRNDREYLTVLRTTAQARIDAARAMSVPKVVEGAHPHLLLVLENTERGLAAAIEGHAGKFFELVERATTEERTFRALISKLGFTVPP